MILEIKISGIDSDEATEILSEISAKVKNIPKPLKFEFHFENEKGPVYRGEDTPFTRYLNGTASNGSSK